MCVAVNASGLTRLRVSDLPIKGNRNLREGDLYVQEVDRPDSEYSCMRWWAIVYRASTGEVFKVSSWDSENSGYSPELPHGKLPDNIVVS